MIDPGCARLLTEMIHRAQADIHHAPRRGTSYESGERYRADAVEWVLSRRIGISPETGITFVRMGS